jgi:antitoxin (DNA-binding transcriptional repressor) of toxin-antitoxin stability system
VAASRRPIIVTKRGKPVAKLAPVDISPIDPFGCMAGTVRILGDIIAMWSGPVTPRTSEPGQSLPA